MKDYDKNKESSYLKYWDVNNLYSWAMARKLPANGFESAEDNSELDECFIKKYNEESHERYFSKLLFNILKTYMDFTIIYHFYLKEWKLKNLKSLLLTYRRKMNMLFI